MLASVMRQNERKEEKHVLAELKKKQKEEERKRKKHAGSRSLNFVCVVCDMCPSKNLAPRGPGWVLFLTLQKPFDLRPTGCSIPMERALGLRSGP